MTGGLGRAGGSFAEPARQVAAALSRLGLHNATTAQHAGSDGHGELVLATWGLGSPPPRPRETLLLTRVCRIAGQRVDRGKVDRLMADKSPGLAQFLPPFAAARLDGEGALTVATDWLGFRQIYLSEGEGWAAVSTSARILGTLRRSGRDMDAVAIASRLGWQLDRRTLFEGVTTLPAGHVAVLGSGRVDTMAYTTVRREAPVTLRDAVPASAGLLRDQLTRLLDNDGDGVDLQLTGGQDSRILLSAVPRPLRPRLTALTIQVAGSEDSTIAAQLARSSGSAHLVEGIEPADSRPPAQIHAACLAASIRLDGMADPLALAALATAEAKLPQRVRISGLGGEVARGFYYLGRATDAPVTRGRSDRLASWRMFANEHAQDDALEPDFRARSLALGLEEVHRLMEATGRDWFDATDEFYLWQRMRRWAGVTDTAVGWDREIVNPMLDHGFVALARALRPEDKQRARYLSQIQVELDLELARVRLDHRPPPLAFAQPGPRARGQMAASMARKASRKASQRLLGRSLPPAGGPALAEGLARHWRDEPSCLDPLRHLGVFTNEWLDQVTRGVAAPHPATAALMVNLLASQR